MTDAPGFPTYHLSFPPPPRILPTVLDPADRRRQWPLLDDILARARDWFPDDGRPLRPFCILTSTEALNGMEIDEGRSFPHLLLFVVPEDFAPQLERLAVQTPDIFNHPTVDLLANDTLFAWRAEGADGKRLSWCVHHQTMEYVRRHRCTDQADADWIPVVFVAGEHVVCGGFWSTDSFRYGGQGAEIGSGVNYRPHRLYDDAELDAAAEQARALGTTRPWEDNYWPWVNGEHFMMLTVLPYGPLSGDELGYW